MEMANLSLLPLFAFIFPDLFSKAHFQHWLYFQNSLPLKKKKDTEVYSYEFNESSTHACSE